METSKLHDRYQSANAFNFPALRGVQSGREFYAVMCQLRQIPRIFSFNETEVPAKLRSQRVLNKGRLPSLVSYVLENPDNYIFSALTASIDGEPQFQPIKENPNIGNLRIPMEATLLINDGQHRRAAIERVIDENPDVGYETIPVIFFIDTGLEQSQQMFADLNKHSVRPTQSLSILYDHRDELSRTVLDLVEEVNIFKGRIEFEKSSISNRSRKLFTLSSVYSANRYIFGKNSSVTEMKAKLEFATSYWTALSNAIEPWHLAMTDKLLGKEFREDYTCAHGVLLNSLGKLGNWLFENKTTNWENLVSKLSKIDWRRQNLDLWDGKAMIEGRMSNTPANIDATFELLKQKVAK